MTDIKAVVFDLYGTLIHIVRDTDPYVRLFSELGLKTPEEFRRASRIASTTDFDSLSDLVKVVSPNVNIDTSRYEKEIEDELSSAIAYPETEKVLYGLRDRKFKLGLISNLATPYKEPFFALGLGAYFDEVVFSCDVGFKKPDPRIYQKMLEKLKINPVQALMTGDKVYADVDGPRSVGMNAVHLNRTGKFEGSIFSIKSAAISSLDGIFKHL